MGEERSIQSAETVEGAEDDVICWVWWYLPRSFQGKKEKRTMITTSGELLLTAQVTDKGSGGRKRLQTFQRVGRIGSDSYVGDQ